MLNRFYEYNSVPRVDSLSKGVLESSLGDVNSIVQKMKDSVDKLGDYIGYVRAENFIPFSTGVTEVPFNRNMRTSIWDIAALLKNKGINTSSFSDIDISKIIKVTNPKGVVIKKDVTYTSVSSIDAATGNRVQSPDMRFKASRTLNDTRKVGTQLGTENGHSKEGKHVKRWEDAELGNEKILLNAIAEAFRRVKVNKDWNESIKIPIFHYVDENGARESYTAPSPNEVHSKDEIEEGSPDRKYIRFEGSTATVEDLIFFFLGVFNQKIYAAYDFARGSAKNSSSRNAILVQGKIESDMGISSPLDWINTAIQVLAYGPYKAADKEFLVDAKTYETEDRDNNYNMGFFETQTVKDVLSLDKFTFVSKEKGYKDVGLFGKIASLVFPTKKGSGYITNLNRSYLGVYISEKFKSIDKSIETISQGGERGAEENSKLPIIGVNRKNMQSTESNNFFSEGESHYVNTLIETLLYRVKLGEITTDIDKGFLGTLNRGGYKGIIKPSGCSMFDFYMGYLIGGRSDKAAVLYSGLFYPPEKGSEENKDTSSSKKRDRLCILDKVIVSPQFLKGLDSSKRILEFFAKPNVESTIISKRTNKPLPKPNLESNKTSGQSIGKLMSFVDRDNNNASLFDFLGTSDKIEECRKSYEKIVYDKNRINLKKIRTLEKDVLCRLFDATSMGIENSDTNWCKSFGLIGNENQNNIISQALSNIKTSIGAASEKNSLSPDSVENIEKTSFYARSLSLDTRINNGAKVIREIINCIDKQFTNNDLKRMLVDKLKGSNFVKDNLTFARDEDTDELRVSGAGEIEIEKNIRDILYESLFKRIFLKSLRESLFEKVFNESKR